MFRRGTIPSWLALGVVCAVAGGSPAAPEVGNPAKRANEATAAKAIRDRLSKPITLEKGIEASTTLREALEFISERIDLTIVVDAQAFKAEGIDAIEDVRIQLPKMIGVKLSTALRLLLTQVDAAYLIRSNYIEVTTVKRTRPDLWNAAERHLAPTVNVEFEKWPLHEALQELSDSSGISIVVDGRAGDKAKAGVTAILNNVPIDTAVLILADMADLRPVALDNVLYVTTKENAEFLQSRQEEQRGKAIRP